ncbi:hypothetical protein [Robertkochia sediminum]|uniref:hypothetical protein n=1 Tax=Robertkochia sediminum TaxID=2785326 RepID=UPI001932F70B|nr:hypothetical protein [Robertkochia sediminum]MBL7472708.1 hypothetical protein [Robertkochia sediminum]
MNNIWVKNIFRSLLWCLLLMPLSIKADIVYPARLELQEIQPGVFVVYFVLPVIQGKVLKAAPVFPEFCSYLEDPKVTGNAYVKEMRWTLQCDQKELYGQSIGISGLLGSQINIILQVNTLEGREYSTTLNPAAAWFEIPYPPSGWDLITNGIYKGMRIPVSNYLFALLLFILILKKDIPAKKTILLLSTGIIAGHLLSYFELLRTPGWIFGLSALLLSLLLAVEKFAPEKWLFKERALILPLLVSTIFLGAQHSEPNTLSGFTSAETTLLMFWTLSGILLGVVLLFLLFRQGLALLSLVLNKELHDLRETYTLLGTLSLGLLIYHASLLWETPSLFPTIPLVLWTLTLMMVTGGLLIKRDQRNFRSYYLIIALFTGIILCYIGLQIPFVAEFTMAMSVLFLIIRYFPSDNSGWISTILMIVIGLGSGLFLAQYTDRYLSYPIARSVEFALILIYLAAVVVPLMSWVSQRQQINTSRISLTQILTVLAVIMVGAIAIHRAGFSLEDLHLQPQLQAPLLSLGLLVAAILFWPRRKKVHKDMGIEKQKPALSLLLLGLSLCCLPVKTGMNNPWFSTANMDQKQIQAVMQQVLSNTYTAFNIEDEEALYEALSSNVDEQLLDNMYLDSRRRLTMGLREGSEVTVEEVRVNLLGHAETPSGESGLSYPASWTVTARVKHLKHIHYRRNRYTGTIEMKTDNDTWKISKIILDSEDREVIPSATL